MDVHLRPARPSESGAAWAIYAEAVRVGAAAHYTAAQRRAWAPETREPAWMAARIAAGRGWIAARAGRDAGFLVAAGLDGEGPALLDLFFVRPEARGSGVASALLAAFDTAAAGRPCTAFASLYLRPILERRGWRMVRADPTERGGEILMRYLMERPA